MEKQKKSILASRFLTQTKSKKMANLKVLQLTGENNTTNIKVKGKTPKG